MAGKDERTMTAALKISGENAFEPAESPGGQVFLDHLRHVARTTRCKGYIDMFGACATLSGNRQVAAQAASEVLMRCLAQALGRRPVLFREGEAETSFDEDWLIALARSLKIDDVASATFLLHSRVPAHARRNLVFLLRSVTNDFSKV
jgi:hypothetical protein